MTDAPVRVAQLLEELDVLHDPGADQELEALKMAIILEETLGIVLDDDDLDLLRLEGPSSVPGLVARRQGSA